MMESSTSRDRDRHRQYKSGNTKRKEKREQSEAIKKLPTLTNWVTKSSKTSDSVQIITNDQSSIEWYFFSRSNG